MGDENEHPLDALFEENVQENARMSARSWAIQLEAYLAAGFTREESIQLFVAFAGKPPGLSAEDAQALVATMIRAASGE